MLGELVPKLCDLLKSGVGLGTKVHNMHDTVHPYTCSHIHANGQLCAIVGWMCQCNCVFDGAVPTRSLAIFR